MLLPELRNLLRHMEWADALLWRAIGDATRPAGDRPLMERLYHLHAVHWAYLQIWRGEQVAIPKLDTFADLPALEAWARACYAELPGFLDSVDQAALGRLITLPWADEIVKRFGSAPNPRSWISSRGSGWGSRQRCGNSGGRRLLARHSRPELVRSPSRKPSSPPCHPRSRRPRTGRLERETDSGPDQAW
jgi:hypothetical protein